VTAFAIAEGPEGAGAPTLSVDPDQVRWFADGSSSYATELDLLIAAGGGRRWVTESSGLGPFFAPTIIPGAPALPAAIDRYFALAAAYGDALSDPLSCAAAAAGTRDDSGSYAAACPPGALATIPGPSPCAATSPPGSIPVTGLVCGDVLDAALAVANLSPAAVWVTRFAGVVERPSDENLPLDRAGATPVPILLTAGGYVGDDCPPAEPGATGPLDAGEVTEGTGNDGLALEPSTSGTDEGTSAAEDASSSDGCDSSTSTSTEDDSGGGGCSGDSSSGDSGGCSGDDSPTVDDCATARRGHRGPSPVSRLVMVASFALGLARRLRRPDPSVSRRTAPRAARG
jgi:hypothetical protein